MTSQPSALVRSLEWSRDGVWTAVRNESKLRLFNAFTYEAMQEVDVEAVLRQTLLSPPQRIGVTALAASPQHLWAGTKSGHVVCAPFKSPPLDRSEEDAVLPASAQVDAASASVRASLCLLPIYW